MNHRTPYSKSRTVVRIVGQPIDKPALAGREGDARLRIDALPPAQRRLCHDSRVAMYAAHDESPSVARLDWKIRVVSHRHQYSNEFNFHIC